MGGRRGRQTETEWGGVRDGVRAGRDRRGNETATGRQRDPARQERKAVLRGPEMRGSELSQVRKKQRIHQVGRGHGKRSQREKLGPEKGRHRLPDRCWQGPWLGGVRAGDRHSSQEGQSHLGRGQTAGQQSPRGALTYSGSAWCQCPTLHSCGSPPS